MKFENKYTSGVSATDMAVLFKISKYRTPIKLFQIKTGRAEKGSDSGEAAYWGKTLEGEIFKHFCKEHPNWISKRSDDLVRAGGNNMFICGKPDGYVNDDAILEIKTASLFLANEWGTQGTDEIPPAYNLQVQTYMFITNKPKAHVVVLIGGQNYKEYAVEADKKLQEQIVEKATAFWKCVLDDTLTDDFQMASDYKFNPIIDDAYKADSESQKLIYELSDLKATMKEMEKEETRLTGEIVKMSENHSAIVDMSGNLLATYKESGRNSFDTKKFKAFDPDLYEQFMKVTKYRRLNLRVKA